MLEELTGVRSSKGRYYTEYRHSAHDLERTLRAVNALSWLLADASGDASYLVDSTLPVMAQLLGASAVVLVSEHPGLGGARVCVPSVQLRAPAAAAPQPADLVRHAEALAVGCPPTGLLRRVEELRSAVLIVPLPSGAGPGGYVVAAVPLTGSSDATDLAILGTLTNQLAGAIESSRRLAESEASRAAADAALCEADAQARAVARRGEQLRRARSELLGAREAQVLAEERERIARDLHDSVAQHVLSMGMQVEWCRTTSAQPEVVERLTEVKDLARLTVDRIRQAIFELSDGDDLQTHGLPTALRRLVAQHRRHDLRVRVRTTGEPRRLPVGADRALFMTVKEALFNTVLHGEAGRASVLLAYGTGEVRVTVSDDGRGRAEQLVRCLEQARRNCSDGYHRGLANIEDRLALVGGQLTISDAPAHGVRVQARIPVQRPA